MYMSVLSDLRRTIQRLGDDISTLELKYVDLSTKEIEEQLSELKVDLKECESNYFSNFFLMQYFECF